MTSDIAQILDSYKREYVMNMGAEGPAILYWIGNMLIALGFVVILFLAIYYANRRIFLDSRYPVEEKDKELYHTQMHLQVHLYDNKEVKNA